MRSHHDSFPAPFPPVESARSPATAAAAHPVSIVIAASASSPPPAPTPSRPPASRNKTTPPPAKPFFASTVRAQQHRPTPPNQPTRNSSPAHPSNCRGKLALALVTPPTPPTSTRTPTTTTPSTTSHPRPVPPTVGRHPPALRQDATNKMRNLHTSRASPINSNNNTITNNKDHSPAPRMPYDRPTPTATSSRQQPQAPSLANKRTPVTPKLAAKNTSSQPSSQRQTVTLAAPVPRRPTRPESTVSQSTSSNLGGSGSKRVSATPRHDNRQSRASSATTSPTPADGPADAAWDSRSGLGIAAPSLDADAARRNLPAANSRDCKFFYASEAPKSAQPPTSAPRPTPPLAKGPTFFYANGTNLPPKPSPATASPATFSPPLSAPASDPLAGKFMYASGPPDLKPSPITTSGSPSVTSTSSKRASSRVGTGPKSPAFLAQRAPSPAKVTSRPAPPTPSTSGPSIAERRSVLSSTPQLSNAPMRRISTEAPPRISSGHSRSGSLVAEPPSVTRTVATSPPVASPLHSPLAFSTQGGLSMASVLQAAEEASDLVDHDDENESMVSGLTSPKSSKGDDPLNELVANARRERKVQDLQITNASLEAINRTLERQLRKQTNELRRFKRLSRAGRLSSANTAPSSRAVSDSATSENPEGPLNELSLSDLSEEEEDDQDDGDLESELSEESSGSACRSPDSATAAKDEKYRKRDEKRLRVDLSKHQQLLVDSQKMNQSLKRCLGWTEELINEGKRALAYQVQVSEVDVEGRAAHEDGEKPFIYDGATLWDHPTEHDRQSLMDHDDLSEDDQDDDDADETMRLRIERLRPADETAGNKSAQDRDSGIVLPGDAV